MVQNDFYTELRDSDNYDNSFGEDIGLEIRTHKQYIYYAFYDIDGNGTMELSIAGGENGVSNPAFPLGIIICTVMTEGMQSIFFRKWSLVTEQIFPFMKME